MCTEELLIGLYVSILHLVETWSPGGITSATGHYPEANETSSNPHESYEGQ